MKATLRYQNGCLYVDHGAWYVKYRQRIAQEDGSSKLIRASKFLGRTEDFANIFDIERCRASFMQIVNRDRLSANSRITITAFVEGAYLPWTKERAPGQHQQGPSRNLEQSPSRSRRGTPPQGLSHGGWQSNVARDRQREGSYDNSVATHQVGAEHHLPLCQK
jgi:hypothetical protein